MKLPNDAAVSKWYDENGIKDASPSSAIYKFRQWLSDQRDKQIDELKAIPGEVISNVLELDIDSKKACDELSYKILEALNKHNYVVYGIEQDLMIENHKTKSADQIINGIYKVLSRETNSDLMSQMIIKSLEDAGFKFIRAEDHKVIKSHRLLEVLQQLSWNESLSIQQAANNYQFTINREIRLDEHRKHILTDNAVMPADHHCDL